jgi:hypothetical protein
MGVTVSDVLVSQIVYLRPSGTGPKRKLDDPVHGIIILFGIAVYLNLFIPGQYARVPLSELEKLYPDFFGYVAPFMGFIKDSSQVPEIGIYRCFSNTPGPAIAFEFLDMF